MDKSCLDPTRIGKYLHQSTLIHHLLTRHHSGLSKPASSSILRTTKINKLENKIKAMNDKYHSHHKQAASQKKMRRKIENKKNASSSSSSAPTAGRLANRALIIVNNNGSSSSRLQYHGKKFMSAPAFRFPQSDDRKYAARDWPIECR